MTTRNVVQLTNGIIWKEMDDVGLLVFGKPAPDWVHNSLQAAWLVGSNTHYIGWRVATPQELLALRLEGVIAAPTGKEQHE